jgi:sugar (pentulose or hexulose) kinase
MFLGIDLGTQSLKATIISQNLKILHEFNINFEKEIQNDKVHDGVNIKGNEVTTPTTCFIF